jgi:hypothetical protein
VYLVSRDPTRKERKNLCNNEASGPKEGLKIFGGGASGNVVGTICPLVGIGLSVLPKTERGGGCPLSPSAFTVLILKSQEMYQGQKLHCLFLFFLDFLWFLKVHIIVKNF